MKTNKDIASIITALPAKSAWSRAVKVYACEMIEIAAENDIQLASVADLKKELLNGAQDWSAYSYGGSALVYDSEICERLCTSSEFKKTRNGEKNPNTRETWLDCQTRALWQAELMISSAIKTA